MLIAVGLVLAAFVLIDAVETAINLSQRPGRLSGAVLDLGRRVGHRFPGLRREGLGIVVTSAILLVWLLGLWLAFSVAMLDPAVVFTADGEPVGWWGAFYASGWSLFTLGTADIEPASGAARILTVVQSGVGLFTVTLSVTYLLSLTAAAIHERRAARQAFGFGEDVRDIVDRAWDGTSFARIEGMLQQLAGDLDELSEHHRTFPVLHDIVPSERPLALAPSLLAIVDAVDLVRYAVPAEARISRATHRQVTTAIDGLLSGRPAVSNGDIEAPPRGPVVPLLEEIGAPVGDATPEDEATTRRRDRLYGLAVEEGWGQDAERAVRTVPEDQP